MADRVIILDVKRNKEMIPIVEIAQCAGRAGRNQSDTELARVDIICGEEDIYSVESSLADDDSYKVNSVFNDNENIGFNLISEIHNDLISNEDELKSWYEKSFAFAQGNSINDINEVISHLVCLGCMTVNNGIYKTTELGAICSSLYFSPEDVSCWNENFRTIFSSEKQFRDGSLVWALSNIHSDLGMKIYDEELVDCFQSEIDFSLEDSQIGRGLAWWYLFGGPSVRETKGIAIMLRNDFKRIYKALLLIFDYNGFDFEVLDLLEIVIQHRIGMEYSHLCKIDGIGKVHAYELHSLGLLNEEDIKNNLDVVENYIENERLKKLIRGNYGSFN